MRHLYLAATGQNRGKTTAALGLLDGFQRRGLQTGFTKPVGQRTVIEDGVPADEDAVLMRATFNLPEPLSVMSPVHIPRGFTKKYIAGDVVEDLGARIRDAHARFAEHDVLVVEGTGHAGVGAVIGLSNAVVAGMLRTPVVIVSEGGVGRPIDEIVLNASLFLAHGVHVAGAIVNKVRMDEQPGIEKTLERGLALHGIPLLGVLPYRPILSNPTLGMIRDGVQGRLIERGPDLDRVIGNVAIAAMEPQHVLDHVGPDTLVICPGDREDVILTLTTARLVGTPRAVTAAELVGGPAPERVRPPGIGLVLTGGYEPRDAVLTAIRQAGMFAAIVPEDTYTVASEIHDLLVKTHLRDAGKIEMIKALVWEHLVLDRVLNATTEAVPA